MGLVNIHNILFNAHILYSLLLGGWAMLMALQNRSISGGFWGAVATSVILAATVLVLGIMLLLQGYHLRSDRPGIYLLYMAWLVVIMPGLFSLLRGRDDRSAAIAFAVLAFFNAATAISMAERFLTSFFMPTIS